MRTIRQSALSLAVMAGTVFAPSAYASPSAADALLQSVAPSSGAADGSAQAQSVPAPMAPPSGLKLDNPFSYQLFAQWQQQTGLSYEMNAWVIRVLKGEYAQAAHQWTSVQNLVPESFRQSADAAWLFVLWKLDLPQSFFEEWALVAAKPGYMESRVAMALDQVIGPGLDKWLWENAILVTPENEKFVERFNGSNGPLSQSIQAWAMLRKGEAGAALLPSLPIGHVLKVPLAQTVALALTRKKDLAGAARVMKAQLEPAIESTHDPKELSFHYLQVARLLYQAGALDAAADYYGRIPSKAPEYFKAQEELTWVWLRQGENGKLRGHLETLGSKLFDDKFAPEVHLVRAISNLKYCFYDEVEKDFARFVSTNGAWAAKVDKALAAGDPPLPPKPDRFSILADRMVKKRQGEFKRLKFLAKESIGAVLPAVGPQNHWVRMGERMQALSEAARKRRSDEYRREWVNHQFVLTESIRKMRFVKVEAMSQIRALSQNPTDLGKPGDTSTDSISISKAAPEREMAGQKAALRKSGKEVFPFDGVLWADEMFRLSSTARARCLARDEK